MRLRRKIAAAGRGHRTSYFGIDDLIWRATLEALGYGGQRELFAVIAAGVEWPVLCGTLAGLPASHRRTRALAVLLEALEAARLKVPAVLRPLRRGNRPEARLRGAAALAARFAPGGIWTQLEPLLREASAGRTARLLAAFAVPGAIGRSRAVEIVSNAVLPEAAAAGHESLAAAVYARLPLPARYGAVKHLHTAVGGQITLNARRQQGMLYLLSQYCTQGGCGKCPLS